MPKQKTKSGEIGIALAAGAAALGLLLLRDSEALKNISEWVGGAGDEGERDTTEKAREKILLDPSLYGIEPSFPVAEPIPEPTITEQIAPEPTPSSSVDLSPSPVQKTSATVDKKLSDLRSELVSGAAFAAGAAGASAIPRLLRRVKKVPIPISKRFFERIKLKPSREITPKRVKHRAEGRLTIKNILSKAKTVLKKSKAGRLGIAGAFVAASEISGISNPGRGARQVKKSLRKLGFGHKESEKIATKAAKGDIKSLKKAVRTKLGKDAPYWAQSPGGL